MKIGFFPQHIRTQKFRLLIKASTIFLEYKNKLWRLILSETWSKFAPIVCPLESFTQSVIQGFHNQNITPLSQILDMMILFKEKEHNVQTLKAME